MTEVEIAYDGAYNVVVECTDCGTERGSSVVAPTTLHVEWRATEHCDTCGGYRKHTAVREAERGEYDGDLICDDCDQQFSNTMDVDLHDCPGDDPDTDGDDPEVICDGGQESAAHVTDEQIEAAINKHDDPDHPDGATIGEVRDALQWVQESIEEVWSDWVSNVENNESTLVYEDSELAVFATGEQNVPRRDLREHCSEDFSKRVPDIVSAIHHDIAREHTEYDWGYEYPLVVRKPQGAEAGQQLVEAVVNSLLRRGLSPGQAWAYYGVEIRGHSRNQWATRCGYSDHSAVSEPLRKAHRMLPA